MLGLPGNREQHLIPLWFLKRLSTCEAQDDRY